MDDKMGDDSVIECVPEGGAVRAYTSWTSGAPNYGVSRENVPQNIIRQIEGSLVDGTIYCKVERSAVSTVRGQDFDLINQRFHLLVASGHEAHGKEHSPMYPLRFPNHTFFLRSK